MHYAIYRDWKIAPAATGQAAILDAEESAQNLGTSFLCGAFHLELAVDQ